MGNNRIIDGARMLSRETVNIPFRMVDLGGFPALLRDDENHNVVVEVYEVDDRTYRRVEQLESYPSFYDRVNIETSVGEAGIYFIDKNDRYVVPSSPVVSKFDDAFDWVKHYQKRRSYAF